MSRRSNPHIRRRAPIVTFDIKENETEYAFSRIWLTDRGLVGDRVISFFETPPNDMNDVTYIVAKWRAPYWTITTPLTLVSAWLLLSKPRGSEKVSGTNMPE
jgi:hypothetical protein